MDSVKGAVHRSSRVIRIANRIEGLAQAELRRVSRYIRLRRTLDMNGVLFVAGNTLVILSAAKDLLSYRG